EPMKRLVALLIMIGAMGVAGDSFAQTSGKSVVRLPEDIVYEGLPGTPQHVTLFGDPAKAALYVDRIKFTAGTKVMLSAIDLLLWRNARITRWAKRGNLKNDLTIFCPGIVSCSRRLRIQRAGGVRCQFCFVKNLSNGKVECPGKDEDRPHRVRVPMRH